MHDLSSTVTSLFIYKNEQRAIESRPGFQSKQSFNFAGNYHPGRLGFGSIRVFNDDRVQDQVSIPQHPHQNFEILSVLLQGEMSHSDNLGNDFSLKTDEVKLMSAGAGLYHGGKCFGETNFLQIWITPNELNTIPEVSTHYFSPEKRNNRWQLQLSPLASDEVLTVKQDLYAYRGVFEQGQNITFSAKGSYAAFLMPLSGDILLHDQLVQTRDSAEFQFQDKFIFELKASTDIWLMIETIK